MAFHPKLILCPTDLSDVAAGVVAWAGQFGERFQSKLEIFLAQWLEPPPYFTKGAVESLLAQMKSQLDAARAMAEKLVSQNVPSSVEYEVVVEEGHAVESIQRRLALLQPDLLVLGSHGRSRVARLLMGSVSENVVRESRCPTLIARVGASGASPRPGMRNAA